MDIIADVSEGRVKGEKLKDFNNQDYYSFKGIPYAKPPLGKLRFQMSQFPDQWQGIRDAQSHASSSFSTEGLKLVGSEDCLYLNVYTPSLDQESLRSTMVFIHGGAFIEGSGNSNSCGPEFLIAQDIVLVTINYRLGALGFLAFETPEIGVPGNAGLKDMVLALQWIQKNIQVFGGDPNSVTVFGESAGAAAIHYLLLSPSLTTGLFHRAILQSGTSNCDWSCNKRVPHQLAQLLGYTNKSEKSIQEFLQNVSAEKIVTAQRKILTAQNLREAIPIAWSPTIEVPSPSEPSIITKHPHIVMDSGNFVQVPTVFGYNSHEGLMNVGKNVKKSKYLHPNFTDNSILVPRVLQPKPEVSRLEIGNKIKDFYYKNSTPSDDNIKPFIDLITDIAFLVPMYICVKKHASLSRQAVYCYKFCVDHPFSVYKKKFGLNHPGTAHAEDLVYLFPRGVKEYPPKNSLPYKTIHRMTKLWTTFAKQGDFKIDNDPLVNVNWKAVTQTEMNYLNIDDELECRVNPDQERMEFWEKIINEYSEAVNL